MPYLKCVDKEEAKYILEEIREGVCGDHTGPQIPNKQSYQNRLLLAYYAGRHKGDCQEVRQVPEVWKCPMPSNRETDDDSLPLAICIMGN